MKHFKAVFWIAFWLKGWVRSQREQQGRAFYLRYIGPFFLLWLLGLSSYRVSQTSSFAQSGPPYLILPAPLTNEDSALPEFAHADSIISRFLDKWKIPAASVAVVRDERLVYAKGFGYTDTAEVVPTDPNHLFRIASVSKLITGVAIAHLMQEGKLSLDGHVFGPQGYLPDSIYGRPWQKRGYEITVRHLLEHTSGFSVRTMGDPAFNLHRVAHDMETTLPVSRKQLIRWQLNQLIPYKPGTRYSYSNVGYIMLHEIVEQVSGLPYEEYVRDNLLRPADIRGMRMGHSLRKDRHPDEVMYFDHPGAPKRFSVVGGDSLVPRPYGGTDIQLLGGAGGWIASAEDLARLVVAIDGLPGMEDVLSQEAVFELTKRGGSRYPLGWKGVQGDRWWRTGSLTGTNAMVYRLDERTTYVIIVNRSQWNGYRFNRTLHGMMRRALATVGKWPEHDLFFHQQQISLEPWHMASLTPHSFGE